ncbi:MAG TPA: prepilin-type N-terminal cleavage/methylation domain-containing protein [Verrucomicrobiae bacterium]|jgi:prepilin-type N-terminal cleavage/methylation domain-containing protein
MKNKQAFTLVELLVVIAIIAILAGLLLPSLTQANQNSKQTVCASNLKQVSLAIRLYASDYSDSLPILPSPNPYPNGVGAFYKQLVKSYVGLSGPPSPTEKVFICPSDSVICKQLGHAYTSYTFNGYEVGPGSLPRITGQKLGAIKSPSKADLVGEWTAFFGGAMHPKIDSNQPDPRNVLGFVDGHVRFVKIYWNGVSDSNPCDYEPPASYDYNWDGN